MCASRATNLSVKRIRGYYRTGARRLRLHPVNNHRFGFLVISAAICAAVPARAQSVDALLKAHQCNLCHSVNKTMAGPSYKQMADEYGTDQDAPALLAERIKKGSARVWGPAVMPAFPKLSDADIAAIVKWILPAK